MAIIFGTGYAASYLITYENELGIEYFIDNNKEKIGKKFYGYEIKTPTSIIDQNYDCIILSSKKYAYEMRNQLLDMGIDKKKIYNAWELNIFESEKNYIESESPLMDIRIRNREDYDLVSFDHRLVEIEAVISDMVIKSARKRIAYPGKCQICKKKINLLLDNQYSGSPLKVNFRERLVCPICRLNNRQRVMARLVLDEVPAGSKVYLTEQVTPMYQCLKKYYDDFVGSEYLGFNVAGGTVNKKGIRHEDLMKLSFGDEELDCIVSNDVLEHVADIDKALKEIYRVLKKEGVLYATLPLYFEQKYTVRRAEMTDIGQIKYLLEPVYHGNPMSDEGSLVFFDYGLDFISFVKKAGFSDAYFIPFYSIPYGNIGVNSLFIFIARK